MSLISPREKMQKKGRQASFEEIMDENSPELKKHVSLQTDMPHYLPVQYNGSSITKEREGKGRGGGGKGGEGRTG